MSIDKQALREAAEKAISEEGGTWWSEDQLASDYGLALHKADAKFIAAANPVTVLALLDELESAEKRIAELTGKPAEEYADDGELLFEIDFCDDLSTSIQTAQWLKELRIRRAAGISVKGE